MWKPEHRLAWQTSRPSLSERYERFRMDAHSASNPAGPAGWTAPRREPAPGLERDLLCACDRLPMASLAEGPPA
jgi:hypothetical protein